MAYFIGYIHISGVLFIILFQHKRDGEGRHSTGRKPSQSTSLKYYTLPITVITLTINF